MTRDEAIEIVKQRWGIPTPGRGSAGELPAFWANVNKLVADPMWADHLRPVRGLELKTEKEK